jgi:hypothetical protein
MRPDRYGAMPDQIGDSRPVHWRGTSHAITRRENARSPSTTRARDQLPQHRRIIINAFCRDLAVQAKRIRQLQEQADELPRVIREWAGHAGAHSYGDIS